MRVMNLYFIHVVLHISLYFVIVVDRQALPQQITQNVDPMLGQRSREWTNIEPTLSQQLGINATSPDTLVA